MMQPIALAQSPFLVSRLAYGCWRIAGSGDPDQLTPEREAEGRRAILAAAAAGYTLFDLADIYAGGASERIFGQVIRESAGFRERAVIATKCGIRPRGTPTPGAPYRYDFSAEHIIASCEESLRRLQTDRIEIYQLHRPDYLMDPAEVADAFSRLLAAGKVRAFGVSNFKPSQVNALRQACPMPLIMNQVEISLHHLQALEDGTLDQCLEHRMTPLAWSPLDRGRIGEAFPIDINSPGHALRIGIRETLETLAREYDTTRPVMALAWLCRHPAGIIPIVGSTNPARIAELTQASRLKLSREDWYRLLEVARGERLP